MSVADERALINAALNAIPGITATDSIVLKAGAAWTQLEAIDYTTGIDESTWKVYVCAPQNEGKAISYLESSAETFRAGLQYPEQPIVSAGFVDEIAAVNLGTNDKPVYGLEITLRS